MIFPYTKERSINIDNASLYPLYLYLPKEIITQTYPSVRSVPRSKRMLIGESRNKNLIDNLSFVFCLTAGIIVLVWPFIANEYGLNMNPMVYSKDDPIFMIARSTLTWRNFLTESGIIPNPLDFFKEELRHVGSGNAADIWYDYTSIDEVTDTLSDLVPKMFKAHHFDKIVEIVKDTRCIEDYGITQSNEKIDWHRKWYHTRTKHPQVSLEEYQDNYVELNEGEQWEIPDPKVDVNLEASASVFTEEFFIRLDETDQKILAYRMNNYTYQEIAEKLGYKTHSAVLKRMKYIEEEFIIYVGRNYHLASYLKPEYREAYENIINDIWVV